ncbi:hypothetical protein E1200_28135 [Actinomadura sp. GC306]|uniref:hypothetical protein n=1 Tax=Actinomadura sp. GC306 TaxID=2530367 RepID=UPI00104B1C23|nr:hypothetical protein [Actinomadura sp. GC306]TDC61785.1 hypothetical protein E1200_28135 [Actinomadura sp. GC306]
MKRVMVGRVMVGALITAAVGFAGVGGATAAQSSQEPTRQDCRTYSSVTDCGQPAELTEKQQACVTAATRQGMTERRAETECRAFS